MDASAKGVDAAHTKRTFAVIYWYNEETSPPWGSNILRIAQLGELKDTNSAREGVVDHIKYRHDFYPVIVQEVIEDTTFCKLSCKLFSESAEREKRGARQAVSLGLRTCKKTTGDGETPVDTEFPGPHQQASLLSKQLPSTNKAAADTAEAAAPSGQPITSPVGSSDEVQIKFETVTSSAAASRWLNDDFLASFAKHGFPAELGTSLEAVNAALFNFRDLAGDFMSQLLQNNLNLTEGCQALSLELLTLRASSAAETAVFQTRIAALEKTLAAEKASVAGQLTTQKNEQTAAFNRMLSDQIRKMKTNVMAALAEKEKEWGQIVDAAKQTADAATKTAATAEEKLKAANQMLADMRNAARVLAEVPPEDVDTGRGRAPSPEPLPVPDNRHFNQPRGKPYYGSKRRGGRGFRRGGDGRGGFDGNGAHRGYRSRSPSLDRYANGPAPKRMHCPQQQNQT